MCRQVSIVTQSNFEINLISHKKYLYAHAPCGGRSALQPSFNSESDRISQIEDQNEKPPPPPSKKDRFELDWGQSSTYKRVMAEI